MKRLLILCCVMAAAGGCGDGATGPGHAESREKAQAMSACEQAVVRDLKSPGSAVFSGVLHTGIACDADRDAEPGGRVCAVKGWVDAQNSYGALVRTEYLCAARFRDGALVSAEYRALDG